MSNPCVVFDGYGTPTTKLCTQDRRHHVQKVDFRADTVIRNKREKFLSNTDNKQNFIRFLGNFLQREGVRVVFADRDADVPIVTTAVNCSEQGPTFVVGEDT